MAAILNDLLPLREGSSVCEMSPSDETYRVGDGDGLLGRPVPVGKLPAGLPGVDDGDVASMHESLIVMS